MVVMEQIWSPDTASEKTLATCFVHGSRELQGDAGLQ